MLFQSRRRSLRIWRSWLPWEPFAGLGSRALKEEGREQDCKLAARLYRHLWNREINIDTYVYSFKKMKKGS
jgi:hypothetical protein